MSSALVSAGRRDLRTYLQLDVNDRWQCLNTFLFRNLFALEFDDIGAEILLIELFIQLASGISCDRQQEVVEDDGRLRLLEDIWVDVGCVGFLNLQRLQRLSVEESAKAGGRLSMCIKLLFALRTLSRFHET